MSMAGVRGVGCRVGLVVAMVVALLPSLASGAAAEVTGQTTRLAGAERIETAMVISQGQWGDGAASLVVLVRSDVPADALAATPLAAGAGPVLLSRVDALPADTAREIERVLSPDGVAVLVGGTAALSEAVEAQVRALGVQILRVAGPNRFATAVEIADHLAEDDARPGLEGAWLADGATFADALLAGSAVGLGGAGVVLLTDGDRMPAETMAVLDGLPTSSISTVGAAATAAAAAAGVFVEQPVVGADAYEISRLLADFPSDPSGAALASGEDFADALAGGADAATRGIPLLLTTRDVLPPAVAEWFDSQSLDQLVVYGGIDAVSDGPVARAEGEHPTRAYNCAGVPFIPEEVLSQPVPAETKQGEVYDALRFHLEAGTAFGDYPEGPWYELGSADGQTQFFAEYDTPSPDGPIGVDMALEEREGEWEWAGAGECRPTAHHPDLGSATWALEGLELAPDATRFTALVTERACASGQASEGRVSDPIIEYRDSSVVVIFFVEPLGGVQECPGNPPTPVEVDLGEPLSDRSLLDGGVWPARQPVED